MEIPDDAPPCPKRRRLDNGDDADSTLMHPSLTRPVSPPPRRKAKKEKERAKTKTGEIQESTALSAESPVGSYTLAPRVDVIPSPFQLTSIKDLPASLNADTVSLKGILGDPLISECWNFNYLHNLDFLMAAFDDDVRDMVKVNVIHGFWKQEDPNRLNLMAQASRYPNIKLHTAYMPEMFGTHHSKMLINFRHDDTAQVIIHTANMIPFDWENMTQAMWKSPLLRKLKIDSNDQTLVSHKATLDAIERKARLVGSGSRFKRDLLNYLSAYDDKRTICKPLVQKLSEHDFSGVRAALVASIPCKQSIVAKSKEESKTYWGWLGLQDVLQGIPVEGGEHADIVVQVSSIATLGPTDKWLDQTLFASLSASANPSLKKPRFQVIFPTADEVRRSLNGYSSGSAIHTKIQSAQQQKQLQYLKPLLYHWAGDGEQNTTPQGGTTSSIQEAGRRRAAPHIKTYVRFTNAKKAAIDWMLVTSANLSKQAWGEAPNAAEDIRICSYEIGVVVWPDLFRDTQECTGHLNATMVPTFKTDIPQHTNKDREVVVGARMPYDLPLVPYARGDMPWVATEKYSERDWKGERWDGY